MTTWTFLFSCFPSSFFWGLFPADTKFIDIDVCPKGLAHKPGDKTPHFGPNGVSGYRVNALQHRAVGVGVYCWFSSPDIVVQSAVKVLHKETVAGIVCPFQWVWENANTPPKGNSTIEHAILVV